MKALRKLSQGAGHVDLVDIPEPTPGDGEVLIKVGSAGICGTDLHIFHGEFSKVRPPVTLGHEFCGRVVEAGPAVEKWRSGDRVAVESEAFSCGECPYCQSGLTNICEQRLAYGYSTDGGFAPFVTVRASALHRLPDAVSFQEGAMSELLAVAVHAVMECATIRKDDWVLITGPGPIGLMVLQAAKVKGARVIISGTEQDAARLQTAASVGADHIVRIGRNGILGKLGELTGGFGVRTAFECSGSKGAVNDCIQSVSRRGRIVQVGLFGSPVEINLDAVALKEITVSGAFAHNHDTWKKAIDLLGTNRIDMKSLISGEFPLKDWKQAFQLSEKGAGLKYLLYSE
ncbi:MAG: zinc-binding dehydrogenase [Deltaproteobacteria bacterium]|nr:zinc-binding dehydrogenase [Deltaproteobacteria bacterium]